LFPAGASRGEGAMPRGNPRPDLAKLRRYGNVPRGYIENDINDWIVAHLKGEAWVQAPRPQFPVVIRKREVMRRTGLSYPTIWSREKKGTFPKGFSLADPPPVEASDAD
jgi:hypothetical protein